ncbi:sodium:solute symporter family protein [Calderihabitans maritimus]|uniref:Sodium:pantothenate symporter n=1 Tax=Calderihabitans maritimus TaxID=1246530 RepID=A0A1Z5HS36_9FIRM|nr:sodium:solute symporter family protein [Calderihabitans maritimus]GAW92336.1 hypothetical protein KKC1_14910 [Calderihabitans maritimus]
MELTFGGWTGIIVLLAYGALMLGIGITVSLRQKDIHESMDNYYLGGRTLGLLALFFTLYATQYSGNTIIGYAPKAYRLGFAWFQSVTYMTAIIGGYLLFAPRLYILAKRHKFLTPSDWLEARFKSPAVTLVGTLLMLYGLGNYLLEQLVAIGHGVSGLTAGTIPYQIGVIFFIVIMLIYSWLGGMRAVAYTDVMQGIALLVGILALLIGSIKVWGGLPAATQYMIAEVPKKVGVPSLETSTKWISLLILVAIGAAVYPHAIQRIYAAGSERTLKRSLSRMAWMPFVTTGLVYLVGLIGIKAFPGLDKMTSEKLVGMMANVVAAQSPFFYWMMILLFGGVVAAIVSTADSVLLSFSSIVSKDIYGRFINPDAPEKQKLMVGKVAGIIVLFILLLIAWNPPGTLYQIFVLKFEVLIQVAPAFILGLYWKRLTKGPVVVGMIAGALVAGMMTLSGNKTFLGFYSGVWGLLLNLAICVVGSFLVSASKELQQEVEKVIALDR